MKNVFGDFDDMDCNGDIYDSVDDSEHMDTTQ